jgi:hypothetical protein
VTKAALNFVIRLLVLGALVSAIIFSLRYGGILGWTFAIFWSLIGVLDAVRLVGATEGVRDARKRRE